MSKRRSINAARRIAARYQHSGKDRTTIVRELRAEGWKQIGRGAFAIVLEHPELAHVVIKVGQEGSTNKWVRERGLRDGFRRYVEFLEESFSKYALKVYSLVTADNRTGTYVAAVEHLYKLNGNARAVKSVTGSAYEARWGAPAWHRVKSCPRAKAFFKQLKNWGSLDISPQNLMRRADGTIVVTDPLTLEGPAYV